ncbi:MAG: hypothetical protein WAU53_00485, partial [Rhodoplanes sp.]
SDATGEAREGVRFKRAVPIAAVAPRYISFGISGCEPPQPNNAAKSKTWRRRHFLDQISTQILEAPWKREGA